MDIANSKPLAALAKVSKTVAMAMMGVLLPQGYVGAQLSAYHEELHNLTGGVVGGVAFSQVDGDGYKGYGKMGYTGGGVLFLPFGEMDMPIKDATIALSMEILFTQKGSKGRGSVTGAVSQYINLQYGEVPFLINLYRGPRKSGFGGGFALGYLAASEETVDVGGGTIVKNGLPFHKFDLNFVLTGNLHLWNGFFLSPRFQYSMISIRNNNSKYGGRDQQFNNVVSIRLMYLFNRMEGN
ncbi:MAG: hypothetical protein QM642_04780 [Edaphocola sp.]